MCILKRHLGNYVLICINMYVLISHTHILRSWWAQKLSNTMNNNLRLILPSSLPHLPGSGNCKAHFFISLLLPLHRGPCHFCFYHKFLTFRPATRFCSPASALPTVSAALQAGGRAHSSLDNTPAGLQLLSALLTFCTHFSIFCMFPLCKVEI